MTTTEPAPVTERQPTKAQAAILRSLERRRVRLDQLRAERQATYDARLLDMRQARALTPPVPVRDICAAAGITEDGYQYLMRTAPPAGTPLYSPTTRAALLRRLPRHAAKLDKLDCRITAEIDGRLSDMVAAQQTDPPILVRVFCSAAGVSEEAYRKGLRKAEG